jgi:predicted anti-sigma-YlaC factor YlaD
MTCKKAEELLNALVDGELEKPDEQRLRSHLESCARCREELRKLEQLEGIMTRVTLPRLADREWEKHWECLYNRLERGVGYMLAGLGALVLLGYGLYLFSSEWLSDASVPVVLKMGVCLLAVGLLILMVSTVREKVLTHRHDRYKEILR